jgi:hypothetical protein
MPLRETAPDSVRGRVTAVEKILIDRTHTGETDKNENRIATKFSCCDAVFILADAPAQPRIKSKTRFKKQSA